MPVGMKQSKELRNLFKLDSIKAKLRQTTLANYQLTTHTRVNSTTVTTSKQNAIKAIFIIFTSEFNTFEIVLNT